MKWARLSAGMSVEEAAKSISNKPDKIREIRKIQEWENGLGAPTYPQLEKLADKYKRPLAVFFFPKPPEEPDLKREFRSLGRRRVKLSPKTRFLIRDAHAYAYSMRELEGQRNPAPAQIWRDISLSMSIPVERQAARILDRLEMPVANRSRNDGDALKMWRSAVEQAGVLVFRAPFLEDNHISGFCLFDEVFPIIFLNSSTSKYRQIFTLLHELAHLLLRDNDIGINCGVEFDSRQTALEAFCNKIAAGVLLPYPEFVNEATTKLAKIELSDACCALSVRYNASEECVLRRLYDSGLIGDEDYRAELQRIRARVSPKQESSGGSYINNLRSYMSDLFLDSVIANYYNGRISKDEASEHLNVNIEHFDDLEDYALKAVSA